VPITVTDWPASEPAAPEPDGAAEAPVEGATEAAVEGATDAVEGAAADAEGAAGLGDADEEQALTTSASEATNTLARASVSRFARDNVHSSSAALTRVTNAHYLPERETVKSQVAMKMRRMCDGVAAGGANPDGSARVRRQVVRSTRGR
jgi:hypothetical protein